MPRVQATQLVHQVKGAAAHQHGAATYISMYTHTQREVGPSVTCLGALGGHLLQARPGLLVVRAPELSPTGCKLRGDVRKLGGAGRALWGI